MAKLTKAPKKVIKKAPAVNENPVKEEVVEVEVTEVLNHEEKLIKELNKLIEVKVIAGQGRFLGLEEILPIFRSIMK